MALGNNPTQLEVVKAIKDLENKPSDDTWRAIYVNGVKYKSNSISGGDLDFRNGDNVTAKIGAKGVTLGVASGYSIPSTTKQSEWDAKADTSDIPTKTSDLTNDSGFITAAPTKVSELTNDAGYVTAAQIDNTNLLINSNFAINQRGASSYTTNNKYTVDRWIIYANASVSAQPQSNGGLQVQNAGSNNTADLTQIIENGAALLGGKTLTLSVNTTINGSTATTILSGTLSSEGTLTANLPNSSGQIHIQLMRNGTFKVWLRTYANKTILFNWAKLEVGDIATEYTPPLIAEELPKCLRYFYRLQSTDTIFICEGHASSTTVMFAPNTLPVPMRATPTMTYSALDDFNLYGLTGTAIALTNLTVSRFDALNRNHTFNCYGSGFTNDGNYVFRAKNANAHIDFDAEIY